jgi:hypothetical protein
MFTLVITPRHRAAPSCFWRLAPTCFT